MPNGTHPASVAGTETSKEAIQVQMPASNDSEATEKQSGQSAEEGQNKPEVSPQKKVIKPPMPPTKEAKPIESTEDEPDKDDSPVKKVCIWYLTHVMQCRNTCANLSIWATWPLKYDFMFLR